MVFEYRGWRLYIREVKLKHTPPVTIYFFSRKIPNSGKPCEIPANKAVGVNAEVGLPFLTDLEQGPNAGDGTPFAFEGWGLYQGRVRDEDTGQMVDVMVFCRSQPKGFSAMPSPPERRAARWHPVNDLPSLAPSA